MAMRQVKLIGILVSLLSATATCASASEANGADSNRVSHGQASQSFDELHDQWKKLGSELQSTLTESQGPVTPQRFRELGKSRVALIKQLRSLHGQVQSAAEDRWLSDAKPDADVRDWLIWTLNAALGIAQYDAAFHEATVLLAREQFLDATQKRQVLRFAAWAAFDVNQFAMAQKYLKTLQGQNQVDERVAHLLPLFDRYSEYWKQELESRRRDSQGSKLPLVKIKTTQGDIVLELFENDSPAIVKECLQFFDNDGCKDAPIEAVNVGLAVALRIGHEISLSSSIPWIPASRRFHFRGSLSVGTCGGFSKPQLSIAAAPIADWNRKNIVIGRVLEGLDLLDRICDGARRRPDGNRSRVIQTIVLRR